ncbi:MAG: CDP-glucose 4,6-dehydratase, partial [Polynucleobacter sp. 35-46-11]|uniref:CDP-glucose 4,6-dehydratase n=1 Tax=Polynucleobacter sp. 35-46-11 TaxID=1970425 RepID=UPI000BD73275
PNTTPNLFTVANVADSLASSTIGDIRDSSLLHEALQASGAEIVFHLAAQPLVRYSYESPVETYSVNVMGTVNLFEAIRNTSSVKAVVNVTTDKCYENREWVWPYREDEAMGGYDPYSSSKGCSELVTAAYRRSFLATSGVAVATARAGNVIGGGDWSSDRLIPDFFRAIDAKQALSVRSPNAVRPWQHVLEPLSGYLTLAQQLYSHGEQFAEAWNFGPADEDARNVAWIVEQLVASIPGAIWQRDETPQPHEANYLKLDSSKARANLNWQSRWNLKTALDAIVSWHECWHQGKNMHDFTLDQIKKYEQTKRNV